ncbi:MAG: hypothetical protein IPH45_04485 [Bacteroidales bacterium]|nr:hypothetical protein [Bacteroidales bacterium]
MKHLVLSAILLLFGTAIIFSGCNKEEDPIPPVQTFTTGAGYISSDIALPFADSMLFGIHVKSNGTDKLVKFQVYANGTNVVDSTISTHDFTINIGSYKTFLDKEVWKFVSTDIAGNMDTDSITVTGNFGEINSFSGITLGAQNNTTAKGFVSFSNNAATTYTQDEAFNHQADIDMFCFYENAASVNLMALAAPGSNINGIFTGGTAPSEYTTKNVTFFTKTDLTATVFDLVTNDALIVASFDPDNKFKKAKLLTAGDVYAFKLASGKLGLLKVTNVTGVEDGSLEFSVKIQK